MAHVPFTSLSSTSFTRGRSHQFFVSNEIKSRSRDSSTYLDHLEVRNIVRFRPNRCAIFVIVLSPVIVTLTEIPETIEIRLLRNSYVSYLHFPDDSNEENSLRIH